MGTQRQLAVLDRVSALDRVGGDMELLREMAQLFLEDYPTQLEQVQAAVRRRDPGALERAAHSLKGSVGNFGAEAAFQAALDLEMLGRAHDLTGAEAKLAALKDALSRLEPALSSLGAGE